MKLHISNTAVRSGSLENDGSSTMGPTFLKALRHELRFLFHVDATSTWPQELLRLLIHCLHLSILEFGTRCIDCWSIRREWIILSCLQPLHQSSGDVPLFFWY